MGEGGSSTYLFLGFNGESEDSVGSAALSVHGGGGHLPVHPASGQHLVGLSGRGHADLRETVHVHTVLHVLSEVQSCRGWVQEVKHLLVVDLKERTLAQKLDQVAILEESV